MANLNDVSLNYDAWEDRRFVKNVPSDEDWNPDQQNRWEQRTLQTVEHRQPFYFSKRSLGNLKHVDFRLSGIFFTAIQNSPYDFIVIEGIRTQARQDELFNQGKSKSLNSRHLTGHAIDIAIWHNGMVDWEFSKYKQIADHVKLIAQQHKIPIEWGGDWINFKDGVHFQLPWSIK